MKLRIPGRASAALMCALAPLPVMGPSDVLAQEPTRERDASSIAGFSAQASAAQAEFEQVLLDAIHPDSAGRWASTLAARPHVAGTPGQVATRDSVVAWHGAAGIDGGYDSLVLYMPHPLRVSVERSWPEPTTFDLAEPSLSEDPATGIDAVPVFNAYSGSGSAEAEVVFAGYGLPADYRTLDSAGVSVEGKIVLARYGRSFRGIKAREAEARGAAGLLLYSDPANDGFVRGVVYPDGPMRPARGVQRGSVLNSTGDPSTPAGPSLPGAPRVPEDQMVGVARIPVIPVGYGVAEALLRPLGGSAAPESWQGGLDLTYRFGPGPTRARLEVRTESGESAYHPAYNTIAVLEGAEWPDEWVVIGAHRDSWSPGAIDNVSGTTSVLEVARAFGAAAASGLRPRRTVVFITWDAEEWGVIGSIEWVEAHADRLRATVVAYVNQDAPVSGSSFGAAASPELKSLARDAARRVDEPAHGGTVYESWLTRVAERLGNASSPEPLPVGDLGGGSDHKGFYQHLGIPAIGFGFGGSGGVYHSMYDTPRWMQEFGDPGYLYHAAVARVAAVVVSRLANADILPYDFVELVGVVRERTGHVESEVEAALEAATATEHAVGDAGAEMLADSPEAPGVRQAFAGLRASIASMEAAAAAYSIAREGSLREVKPASAAMRRVNERLRSASRSLTSEDGLPGDAWSRQLLFASDPDNGYATLPLPAIRLALRAGDLGAVADRVRELADHLDLVAAHLKEARAVLEGRG
ncbi:MAG: M20/M25/M40 family metallo-hydrolase [Gemmatimonadetes bacterium]|nr:M20/M25/M40 family metallo-hydrolase [Gemmatimonadota bacterium]